MQPENKSGNVLIMPAAIVIAGALIAGAVYLSNTKGNTKPEAQNANNPQAQVQAAAKISLRPISDSDHFLGNPEAPLQMIVFTDLECPFCKLFHTTAQGIADNYGKSGKVVLVYRDFPLAQLHPKAPRESLASECASQLGGQNAYWKFVDRLFEITPSNNGLDESELPKIASYAGLDKTRFAQCLDSDQYTSVVQTDYNEAIAAGGRGTPFTAFIVKQPLAQSQIDAVTSLGATYGPDTFGFSTDKKIVTMSGALPIASVNQVINILLGQKAN